jgi:hypothetical protein
MNVNSARFGLLALALLGAGAAAAQTEPSAQPQGFARMREACRADVQKLCPDVQPGHGALAQCLHSHQSDLSSDCRDALKAVSEHLHERREGGQSPAPPPPPPQELQQPQS